MLLRGGYTFILQELTVSNYTKVQWLLNLLQPLAFLIFFLPALSRLIGNVQIGGSEVSYLSFVIPGLIASSAINYAVRAGVAVYIDKLTGEMENLFTLPMSPMAYILGKTAAALPFVILYTVVASLALLFFGYALSVWGVLLVTLISILAYAVLCAINLLIAALVSNDEALNSVINLISLPLSFASTAFYPLKAAPQWLQPFIQINPVSLAADGGRCVLFGGCAPEMLAVAVLGLVGYLVILYILVFRTIRRIFE